MEKEGSDEGVGFVYYRTYSFPCYIIINMWKKNNFDLTTIRKWSRIRKIRYI